MQKVIFIYLILFIICSCKKPESSKNGILSVEEIDRLLPNFDKQKVKDKVYNNLRFSDRLSDTLFDKILDLNLSYFTDKKLKELVNYLNEKEFKVGQIAIERSANENFLIVYFGFVEKKI